MDINKKRQQKGITIIALVITIIIMLILLSVTISMVISGGLFEEAGKAVGKTQNAMDQEKQHINDITEEYFNPDVSEEEVVLSYDQTVMDTKGFLTAKAIYTSGNDTAIIPKGFAVLGEPEEKQSIENGLVIKDSDDNEFVWIPVKKAIVTEEEISAIRKADSSITSDLEAVQSLVNQGIYPIAVQEGTNYKGILYNFSGTNDLKLTVLDWTGGSTYKEPGELKDSYTWTTDTDVNGTTIKAGTSYVYDSQEMFSLYGMGAYSNTLYQKAFNSMVKSVDENGGFYVGRYEISLYINEERNSIKYAQSKKDQAALVSVTWYEMYKYERDYSLYNTGLGVTSEMLWGSQWDQMMIFINGKEDGGESPQPFYVTQTNSRRLLNNIEAKTGENSIDKVANIYDLEASRCEWVQEICSSDRRTNRGGYYAESGWASIRRRPNGMQGSATSSRLSLYIQ